MDKQIEEMAKSVSKNCDGTVGGRTCYSCRLGMFNRCIPFEYAKRFYNAGYRKIPEGAVVLTREEQENHIIMTKVNYESIMQQLKQTRKETAEKFAERVKMAFYYEFDELIPSIMADKIDEICKKITEGKNE